VAREGLYSMEDEGLGGESMKAVARGWKNSRSPDRPERF